MSQPVDRQTSCVPFSPVRWPFSFAYAIREQARAATSSKTTRKITENRGDVASNRATIVAKVPPRTSAASGRKFSDATAFVSNVRVLAVHCGGGVLVGQSEFADDMGNSDGKPTTDRQNPLRARTTWRDAPFTKRKNHDSAILLYGPDGDLVLYRVFSSQPSSWEGRGEVARWKSSKQKGGRAQTTRETERRSARRKIGGQAVSGRRLVRTHPRKTDRWTAGQPERGVGGRRRGSRTCCQQKQNAASFWCAGGCRWRSRRQS